MKSLILFLQIILQEMGDLCGTSTALDLKKIKSRVEDEGLSFLTITLPNFGKDFEKSLDQGYVSDDLFQGFSRTGGLPRILSGFLRLVFDRDTGKLLDAPSIDAIRAVRQITLMFSKILVDCSPERVDSAIAKYIECEQIVRESDASIEPDRFDDFLRIGRLLWSGLFSEVDESIYYQNLIPQHGPGSTADRLLGNQKWNQIEWPTRLETSFPSWVYLSTNEVNFLDLNPLNYLEPRNERPVRVVTVPKTLKTPRIIAIEPTAMQYAQQAVRRAIEEAIRKDDISRWLIRYSDQTPNQRMAERGSRDGKLATLDLSEASDRVSNQHVRGLLRNFPHLSDAVDSSRSRKADVPGYYGKSSQTIRLAKFASMGSALCFPFEAIVFATVIFLGIERVLNRPITKKDIKSFEGQVRVYGDDIIVPVDYVSSVVRELEAFGFRVNSGKSFWSGKFRESCGKEYYDGEDVSITRIRRMLPTRRTDVLELISTASLRNQLYQAGLWRSAAYLDNLLEELIPWPVVKDTSPGLGRYTYLDISKETHTKWDRNLHKPLVKAMVITGISPVCKLDGYGALLKCLTLLETRPIPPKEAAFLDTGLPPGDEEHLERSGRPRAVTLKPRLVPPY